LENFWPNRNHPIATINRRQLSYIRLKINGTDRKPRDKVKTQSTLRSRINKVNENRSKEQCSIGPLAPLSRACSLSRPFKAVVKLTEKAPQYIIPQIHKTKYSHIRNIDTFNQTNLLDNAETLHSQRCESFPYQQAIPPKSKRPNDLEILLL